MPGDRDPQKNTLIPLNGFQKPNEILTPNQFFDVCLPHHSTPVIRVVGFILRETLGYTNDDGDPFQERFRFSYQQIADGAGVALSAVKQALDEAVAARFLKRVKGAVASSKGQAAESAEYELRWHDYEEKAYLVDPRKFRGFFAAEGNRTSIPEEFFTHVLRHNTKATIRFVGAVIRNTLGIKASHGRGRVKRAKLSYRYLQRYLHLSSRALANAIKRAMAMNYVQRLEAGVFDSKHPENNREAIYTVKWCDQAPSVPNLSTPKSTATDHTKKYSEPTPKSTAAFHTKKYPPVKRFPNGNHYKQQEPVAVEDSFPSEHENLISALVAVGFQEHDASQLVQDHDAEKIRRQIAWLPDRQPIQPPALLRRALAEDWAAPIAKRTESPASPEAIAFAKGFYAGRWDSETVASEPSARDLQGAESLVHKLSKIHGTREPDQAAAWGKRFGRHYGREYPKLIPSLAYAARVLADDLIRSHQRQAESRRVREQLDLAHQAISANSKRQDWLDHLEAHEGRLRENHADAFAAFEEHRAKQRENIQRSGLPQFAERLVRFHDQRATRLSDLQKAFPEHLPDFETWTQSHSNRSTSLSTNI